MNVTLSVSRNPEGKGFVCSARFGADNHPDTTVTNRLGVRTWANAVLGGKSKSFSWKTVEAGGVSSISYVKTEAGYEFTGRSNQTGNVAA